MFCILANVLYIVEYLEKKDKVDRGKFVANLFCSGHFVHDRLPLLYEKNEKKNAYNCRACGISVL